MKLFLFKTHLHQLPEIEVRFKIKNIIALHLSVMYKDEEDKLILMKISFGSGSSMYGLEYAKSFIWIKSFI